MSRLFLSKTSATIALAMAGVLSLCGVSLGAAASVRQMLADAKKPVRIVCMGDSITGVYYHSGGVRAYPEMLHLALQKLHPAASLTVHNAGISGDTTQGGLARLERDVLSHKPHLVTIMFGMNDLVRLSAESFITNLRQLVRRCREAGADVILCTQNSIVDTPQRPVAKLSAYAEAIRDLSKSESTGLADCFAAFERVRSKEALEWNLLLSDAIHPNMDGHKLFAETIARAITGAEISLHAEPPPPAPLAHTLKLLGENQPVKVLAMPPYDRLIGPALRKLHPAARLTVQSWPTAGRTLAELETSAKNVRTMRPDLVIIAVPGNLDAKTPQAFHHHYAWIMNWSLSFGRQEWDVVTALPPVTEQPHVELARRLVRAQDLNLITGPGQAALEKWLWTQKAANPQDIVFQAAGDRSQQRFVEQLPANFEPEKPHDVLIALHGHGADRWQFIRDPRGECRGLREVASKHRMIYLSPDYRGRTSWMGPAAEADLVQIIAEIQRRYRVGRVFLAGGSMGGTSALIFATLHPQLIAGVCALNPTANLIEYAGFQEAIDASYGSAAERQKRSPEMHAERLTMPVAVTTGGKDQVVPPDSALRLIKKLNKALSLHREDGGHSTSMEDTVQAMEWCLKHAAP